MSGVNSEVVKRKRILSNYICLFDYLFISP